MNPFAEGNTMSDAREELARERRAALRDAAAAGDEATLLSAEHGDDEVIRAVAEAELARSDQERAEVEGEASASAVRVLAKYRAAFDPDRPEATAGLRRQLRERCLLLAQVRAARDRLADRAEAGEPEGTDAAPAGGDTEEVRRRASWASGTGE